MNRSHKRHEFKRAGTNAIYKAEELNDAMRKDCMDFIFPRLREGVTRDDESIRFAQKIFRELLQQSRAFEG